MDGHRGRARSRTYSTEDSDFTGEIHALNAALDGTAAPSEGAAAPAPAPAPAGPTSTRSGVSRKTIDIMTKLDGAAARGGAPELGGSGDERGNMSSDDEEAAAERELAEQERRKRAAEASGAGAGAGAGASASSSGGPAGGRSGTGARRGKKPEDGDYDVLVKVLLLGDSGVGKTSLMLRYSEDKFSPSLTSTAGVDYKSQLLNVDGKRAKCQIWDTAGQQRFHVITHSYYKSAHGIVLVYDVSEQNEER
jgi:hypothetical protein